MASKPANEPFCATRDAIRILEGKWTLQIVHALLEGPKGFNDLARAIGGCNSATLSSRLESLSALGLVSKRIDSTMPPRTCYSLTAAGEALHEAVAALERWGERYLAPGGRRTRGPRASAPSGGAR